MKGLLVKNKEMKFKFLYLFVLVFAVFSCKKSDVHLTKITAKTININDSYKVDAEIDSVISPYRNKLQSDMEEVLCYAPKKLVKFDGEMQSTAGNFMADGCFEIANPVFQKQTNEEIDFVLFNHGGIRASIPAGDVTRERAFKIMPFENELYVTKLSGEKVQELFEFFTKKKTAHPLSDNVQLTIDGDEFSVKINGKPFDKSKSYNVLTNDYLFNGGNRMVFFANPEQLTILNLKVRDALIAYFIKVDTLKAEIDNRVIVK